MKKQHLLGSICTPFYVPLYTVNLLNLVLFDCIFQSHGNEISCSVYPTAF